MPKKTKKEKLLAEQHRMYALQSLHESFPQRENPNHLPPVEAPSTPPRPLSASSFQLIRRDITKTVLLGVTAIAVEVLLFLGGRIRP